MIGNHFEIIVKRSHQAKPVAGGRGIPQFSNLQELGKKYEAAFMRRDMEECKQILKQLLKANPRSIDATLQKGRLLGVLCRFKEAKDSLQQAVSITPEAARATTALRAGLLARDFYDPSIAEYFYRKAMFGEVRNTATMALAEHFGRIRRREEARALLDSVLDEEPDNPQAIFLKARIGGYHSDETEKALLGLINGASPELRVRSGYELGNLRDRRGDYEGAMKAFVSAKGEMQQFADPMIHYRKQVRARFEKMCAELSVDSVKPWREKNYRRLGRFSGIALIAGHPRSGTTLLEQIIDSHSATISAEETENFSLFAFAPLLQRSFAEEKSMFQGLDSLRDHAIEEARTNYLNSISRVLGATPDSPLLIDKNPSLSHLVPAFFRIFPESKTISMIRDPRDVILSCFMQPFVPVNPVTACYMSLTECASEYADVMKTHVKATDVFADAVLEVRYEDLVQDVETKSREVLEFLGLPWEEEVLGFYRRAEEKIVRSPTSEAVTENVHQRAMNRWKNYEKHFGSAMDTLEPFLNRWGY
jgi:tetratricopeptide (TPR) repeat protein